MRSHSLLSSAAAVATCLMASTDAAEWSGADFMNHVHDTKDIDPDSEALTLAFGNVRNSRKNLPKRGRNLSQTGTKRAHKGSGGKYYSSSGGQGTKGSKGGGGRGSYYPNEPQHHDDQYYEPSEPAYDDHYYYPHTNSGPTEDSKSAEEVVFLSAFQDNRFSSFDPVYASSNSSDPDATGNLWLYADVPLQKETGIDVEPLLGFAQGTCQGIFSNEDGYCHFTYEFFDQLEVIASITVEGETLPAGTSILTITGGTGELQGATGEVSLTPASLDDSVIPPRIVEDGSNFLGNPFGYVMEAIIYVRYRVADVTWSDDTWSTGDMPQVGEMEPDMEPDIEPDIDPETTTPEADMDPETPPPEDPIDTLPPGTAGETLAFGRVICSGMDPDLDYCDCDYDCEDSPTHRCGCDEAWTDSCCGTAF